MPRGNGEAAFVSVFDGEEGGGCGAGLQIAGIWAERHSTRQRPKGLELSAQAALEGHKDRQARERPGQVIFRLSRRAGRVRRRPSVPEVLTGIQVLFQGSSEWLGRSGPLKQWEWPH